MSTTPPIAPGPIQDWMDMWRIPELQQNALGAWTDAVESWRKAVLGAWSNAVPAMGGSPYAPGLPGVPAIWNMNPFAPTAPSAPARPTQYPPGLTIEQLTVGQSASLTRTVTQQDIDTFAVVSGDTNPVHIDEAWAKNSFFKGRISHGVLTAGLISAVIGMQLPGPGTIYLSQTLKWTLPVRPGDELTATATIREVVTEKNRVILDTVVTRGEETVLSGEALVMPPKAPK